ncbi:MAG: hypothetical protein HY650_14790 [Acidobacteria bacterium]|nr:hypothetical protein [Acidobacteriota bacterium]
MKVLRRSSRQQHRAAERLRMVEQFHRSGLTRAAFSEQYGIPPATLNWWLAKARSSGSSGVRTSRRDAHVDGSGGAIPVVFSEVRLPAIDPATRSAWAMELTSGGLTVRLREALSLRELARLLRG